MTMLSVAVSYAKAMEGADPFVIQDIEYKSYNGTAQIEIATNAEVNYVVYELEDPYRIVIDPLDSVWCDFEEAVYFREGVIRSIQFIKGRETAK
jgi:hypothetical protein